MTKEDKNPTEDDIKTTLSNEGYWIHIKEACERSFFSTSGKWDKEKYVNHHIFRANDVASIQTVISEKHGDQTVYLQIALKNPDKVIVLSKDTGEKFIEKFEVLKGCILVER